MREGDRLNSPTFYGPDQHFHMLRVRSVAVPRVDQLYAGVGEVWGIPGCQDGLVLATDRCDLCIEGADRPTRVSAACQDVRIVGRGADIEGKHEACERLGEQ